MKWIFLLLLLANLVLAAWGQYGRQAAPNPFSRQEINPDKIRFAPPPVQSLAASTPEPLSNSVPLPISAPQPNSAPQVLQNPQSPPPARSAPQPLAKPPAQNPLPPQPAKAPPVKQACYKWGVFSGDTLTKARGALETLAPSASIREQTQPKSGKLGFWVYLPPKQTKQEALGEIRVLDRQGVKDHFLIQDSGKWQYAISLGIFSTDEAAMKYAAIMHKHGVRSAVSGSRDNGEVTFLISAADASLAEKIGKLDFPKTKLETLECAAIAGKASPD